MYCLFGRYYLCCDSWSGETINLSTVSPVFMLGIFEIKSHNTDISLFHKIWRISFLCESVIDLKLWPAIISGL